MAAVEPDIQAIFAEAITRDSKEDRVKYLEEACMNQSAVRARVDALLRAHSEAGGFFGGQPAATEIQPIIEKPGMQIGPYKIREQIGLGGFGAVFVAEQAKPVRRKVALKVIKPGMDTEDVIARFEAERQALALMDHPNVARVLDAGATESGRPYFAMELVQGVPISEFCDEQKLSTKERLRLFVDVCQAVQHAHQKGIIHRDIKPSNVMVTMHDHRPVPKVIDFGVAKAIGSQLTDNTIYTAYGQMVGTPMYMSPEQAQMSGLDVDTRSDIYSLGVLLYELLTGTTPFDKERLHKSGFDEMRRIIREEEPPRPSERLSTLNANARTTVAERRRIDAGRLGPSLCGELDWIVLKAMEKDRGRRYETASKFAEDVQHYLNDEPVVACPPSATYQLKKFLHRHRSAVVTAALAVCVGLTVVGSIGWTIRDRGVRESQAALRKKLQKQRIVQRGAAILDEVKSLAKDGYWSDALASARRLEPLMADVSITHDQRARFAQAVAHLKLVQELEEARLVRSAWTNDGYDEDASERFYLEAFQSIGIDVDVMPPAEVVSKLKSALPIRVPVASGLDDWGSLRRRLDEDEHERADRLFAVARLLDPDPIRNRVRAIIDAGSVDSLEQLVSLASPEMLHGQPPATLVLLGSVLRSVKKFDESIEVLRFAQRMHPFDFWINYRLASYLRRYGSADREAIRFFSVAQGLRPGNTAVLIELGIALHNANRTEEALACYRLAIRLNPQNAYAHNNLAWDLSQRREIDESVRLLKHAIEHDPDYWTAYQNLCFILRTNGRLEEAAHWAHKFESLAPDSASACTQLGWVLFQQESYTESARYFRRATELAPGSVDAWNGLGLALKDSGNLDEAKKCFRKGIELDDQRASVYGNLGNVLRRQGKLADALKFYEKAAELDPYNAAAFWDVGLSLFQLSRFAEAIGHLEKAIELDPGVVKAYNLLGLCLEKVDKQPEAIQAYRKAVDSDSPDVHALNNLGNLLKKMGRYEEAIAVHTRHAEVAPKDANRLTDLAWTLATCPDASLRDPRAAIDFARKAIRLQPDRANHRCNLGVALYRAGKWSESVEALRNAPGGNGDLFHRFFLAMAYWQLDDQENARRCYREALAYWHEQKRDDHQLMRFRDEAEELLGITLKERDDLLENSKQILIDYYTKILGHDSEYWEAYRKRGDLYRDTQQPEKAIADYTFFLEARPNDADVWSKRSASHCRMKKWQPALDDINRALELDPKPWMYSQRAWPLIMLGRYEDAVSDCNRALEQDPNNATAMNRRSWAEACLDRLDLAVADAVKAVIMEPSSNWHWIRLRKCARKAQNLQHLAPLDDLQQFLRKNPETLKSHTEDLAEMQQLRASLQSKTDELEPAAN